MIWERLIKWKEETIDLLNKELTEYQEPGMERFNMVGQIEHGKRFIRRAHVDVVDVEILKGYGWYVCVLELTNGEQFMVLTLLQVKRKLGVSRF